MMKPTDKSDKMVAELETLSHLIHGRSRVGSILSDSCVSCGGKATEFEDNLSRKEFAISGLCQTCQDGIFSTEENNG